MTVTCLVAGARVRTGNRRARWAAAAAVVVAVLAGIVTLPAPGADAAVTPTTPTTGVDFTLAPVSAGIVEAGEPLTVSLTVENSTTAPLATGSVSLSLGSAPIENRAALEAWLDSDGSESTAPAIVEQPVQPVSVGESRTFGLMVEAGDPALADRGPGVYALFARYTVGDSTFVSTSAMVVPDPAVSARVGVVVPITASARSDGLLSREELVELTAVDGSLTAQLDAVDGTAAILAVDPAIVASIRVLGTSAPPTATEWVNRLLAMPNSRFQLQYGDADVAVQLAAGVGSPLSVRPLTYAMDPANFIVLPDPQATPTPTPTPTPAVDPTQPVLPTQAELLDIGTARENVFWPAPATADAAVVDTLSATASGSTTAMTLIPSSTTVDGQAGRTVGARASVGEDAAGALVYDSAISNALAVAARTSESPLRAASLTKATALLAFATRDAGTAPLLVTVDRGEGRSRVELRSAITAMTDAPGVQAVPLGTVVQTEAVERELLASEPDTVRVASTASLLAGERSIEDFATILTDPTLLTGPERSSLLQLLAVAWIPQEAAWVESVQTHQEQTTVTLGSVGILPSATIQLLSPGSDLPFAVRNDLPYPINVVLFTTPDDFRLDVQRATEVTAEPASNQGVRVPVQARVGSGQVDLSLQLRSPTGIPIGTPQTAEVQVRADWEGYGITALAVIVIGLLVIGLFRTIRRRRRAAAEASKTAGDDSDDDDGTAPVSEAEPTTREPDPR